MININEKTLQTNIMQHLDYLGKLTNNIYAYHIANEGKRSIYYGKSLKKQGLKAGVPDIVIMLNGWRTIYLEVKVGNNKQTQSQKDFENICKQLGFPYFVVRSVDDVIEILKQYNCLNGIDI